MKLHCHDCDAIFDSDEAQTVSEWEPAPSPGFPHGSEVRYSACPVCYSLDISEEEQEPSGDDE